MTELLLSTPVVRGCGTRQDGGVYLDFGGDANGDVPFSHLLIDPPFLADAYRMSMRGMQMIERDGIWHLVDWVGARNYPNPSDFFEEAKRFGVSRRIQANQNFSKLSKDSLCFLIHNNAYIENLAELMQELGNEPITCPKSLAQHRPPALVLTHESDRQMCAGYWYHTCKGALVSGVREFTEKVTYPAYPVPRQFEIQFRPAIFMAVPACQFAVVGNSSKAIENYEKLAIAQRNGLNVVRVEA